MKKLILLVSLITIFTSCSVVKCRVYDTSVKTTENELTTRSCIECSANRQAALEQLKRIKIIK